MASSRSMRRSRRSTPLAGPPQESLAVKSEEMPARPGANSLTEWEEPPLRPPAPSFEDYKGVERHGVLEYMQPLGDLPNQRVKQRMKTHDHPRRAAPVRNGEHVVRGVEDISTPDPAPRPRSRRSESRKTEDRPSRSSAAREQNGDSDYVPAGQAVSTPAKAQPPHSSKHDTPSSSRASLKGPVMLKRAVEGAIANAHSIDRPGLGHALQRLYDKSFESPDIATLLDAIMFKTQTAEQEKQFRRYIKWAQKNTNSTPKPSQHSDLPKIPPLKFFSKSPKSVQGGVASSEGGSEANGTKTADNSNPTSHPQSPTKINAHNKRELAATGSQSVEQPPSKRTKRSNSESSLTSVGSGSSLSSLDPNVALEAEEEFRSSGTPLPPTAATGKARSKVAGPRMGTFAASIKRPRAAVTASHEDEELAAKKRQKLRQHFDDYSVEDSHVRTAMQRPANHAAKHESPRPLPKHAASSNAQSRHGIGLSTLENDSDALESPATSIHSDLLIPPPPYAGISRRGATPSGLGRPPKMGKKSARVKMSPLKKKNGVVAGMARSGGVRQSPIGPNVADGEGQNDDYCAACGGPGQLLCCDGCPRSYHFTCVDPPHETAPAGEDWYCQACDSQPSPANATGVFPVLLHKLRKRTPRAFILPAALRNYYEDAITGEDGEYEEPAIQSKAKTRNGYDVPVDTLRVRDAKDNIILCYSCNESAMGGRHIVDCDFCNLHWHLDCLDPPLASAPKRTGKGTWKCPNHVDSEIALPPSSSGRKRKIRRPKRPTIITPAIKRGIKNDGNIEIEDEVSEEEEQPPGAIYRLPAVAVKLDFIAKIRQQKLENARTGEDGFRPTKVEKRQRERLPNGDAGRALRRVSVPTNKSLRKDIFKGRSQAERQTALSLAQFAQSDGQSQLSGNRVEELIGTLISEAPANVIDASNSTSNGDALHQTNGESPAASTRAKAAASNKAAHATNQTNSLETAPATPSVTSTLTAQAELAELLRLEQTLLARIAVVRTASNGV